MSTGSTSHVETIKRGGAFSPVRKIRNQESLERGEFLKERLCLFSRISSGLCLSFFLVTNSLALSSGAQPLSACLDRPRNQSLLVACLVLLVTGCLASRGSPSAKKLLALDASTCWAACTLFALGGWLDVRADPELSWHLAVINTLLGFSHVLIGRAVIIPSEMSRTFWIGAASFAPIAASCISITATRPRYSPHDMATIEEAILLIWGAVAVVASTITSRIIFGLRREIRLARRLGNYLIEEKIGEGSMGEVYKAQHGLLLRPTAIKLLRRDRAGEKNIARFEREVQITSALSHPNTVAIYDYGRTSDGTFFYAMEYLSGITLEDLVDRYGPQPPGRVIHVLKQVCGSLAEAHDKGVIHRDIKGANVILCRRGGIHDVVKVLDFGLVKNLENGVDLVRARDTIAGTPLYMSPETIRCAEIDHRSDIYSLGVLGYFLITAKYVFDGDSPAGLFKRHLEEAPIRPSIRLGDPVPGDLEHLILGCLQKDPQRRPSTARALRDALERCRDSNSWDEAAASRWWQLHRSNGTGGIPKASDTVELLDLDDQGRRSAGGGRESSGFSWARDS